MTPVQVWCGFVARFFFVFVCLFDGCVQATLTKSASVKEVGHIAGYSGHVAGLEHVAGGRSFAKAT
jgi:hypothetical protein